MSATPIVRAALAANPAVATLVDTRIFYSAADQGAVRPYLIITAGIERDGYHLSGADRWPDAAFEVIAVADTHSGADRLGDAVVAALGDASGTFAGKSARFFRDAAGGCDFVPDEKVHRRIIGFRCRYR